MKLVFYLYRKFFGIFIGALAFFCLVLNIADLLMNLWRYISVAASPVDVGKIAFFYIPKTVSYSVPIAVLFATAYTLSDLYAKNELTAIFACGVSLLRFTMPLLVFSIFMSLTLFFFEDRLVVSTYARKQSLQKTVLKQEETKNNDKIVIMSDGGKIIYKADFYDDELHRLSDVYIVVRNDNKELDSIFRADFAEWQGSFWKLSGASQYKMVAGEISLVKLDKEIEKSFSEIPETFRKNTISVDEVTTTEAREYIEHLLKAGLPAAEAQSIYYKKYSFPFVVFIVVFVAIGLSGKTQKNVLLVSLGLSISAVVLFYVVQMVTMLMAKFGAIPPMTGAWFPVILFIIISIILLQFART